MMSLSRHVEEPGKHTEDENWAFLISIFFAILTSISWGMLNVISKWVGKKCPEAQTEDFSNILLFISGITGVLFCLFFYKEVAKGWDQKGFFLASLAGFISAIGLLAMF